MSSKRAIRPCSDCRRNSKRFGTAKDRRFYATSYGIRQLSDHPSDAALIIAEKFRARDFRLVRRWAYLCSSCRDQFAKTHSHTLERCFAELTADISAKVEQAESAAAELHYFAGAADGVLTYFRRVRKELEERRGRDATAPGYVYAIRSGRHLKIGFAKDVSHRMSAIQVSSPDKVELVGSLTAYPEDERRIHQRFAQYRVRGEWFKDCPQLRRFFETTLCAAMVEPAKTRAD